MVRQLAVLAFKKRLSPTTASTVSREERTVMPFGSSTVFFADRFASAFPGVREITWYNEEGEVRKD